MEMGQISQVRAERTASRQRAAMAFSAAMSAQGARYRAQAAGNASYALPAPRRFCTYQSRAESGLNAVCYYDCASSVAAYTVGVATLCPLNPF